MSAANVESWDVNCPACQVKNTLARQDLGVWLNCGACGSRFIFDQPLKVEKAKERAEREKIKSEEREKARVERERQKQVDAARRAEEQRRRTLELAAQEEQLAQQRRHEEEENHYRQLHGGGCPRCGSIKIKQTKHTSGFGWLMFGVGLVLACFTFGAGLILCVIGAFLNTYRSTCSNCNYKWGGT